MTIPLDAIRRDLLRVAEMEGRPEGIGPSRSGYHEHGSLSFYRVLVATGGYRADYDRGRKVPRLDWPAMLRAHGLRSPNTLRVNASRERLGKDLRRVARIVGRPKRMPRQREYRSLGEWSHQTIYNHFGGWTEAALFAGLRPRTTVPTASGLLREYRTACARAGHRFGGYGLTEEEFGATVEYSVMSAASRRFGSFNDLVRRAGFRPRQHGGEARWWRQAA